MDDLLRCICPIIGKPSAWGTVETHVPLRAFVSEGIFMSTISINTPAPDFELADATGKPVRLSDFRGRNVLLVLNRGFV